MEKYEKKFNLEETALNINYDQFIDEIKKNKIADYITFYTQEPSRLDIRGNLKISILSGRGLSISDKNIILETTGDKAVVKVEKDYLSQSKIHYKIYYKTKNMLLIGIMK